MGPPGKVFDAPAALEKISEAVAPVAVYEIKASAEEFMKLDGFEALPVNPVETPADEEGTASIASVGARIAAAGVIEAANLWLESRKLPGKAKAQRLRESPKTSPPGK